MNELARRNNDLPAPADWQTMLSMAEQLVASGMLPKHITTPAAAVAIIQRGRELGIPPMYALNNIVYIQGKATTNSELMLALIYRDHGDGALVFGESSNTLCVVRYKRRHWPRHEQYEFTIEDAKVAGLLGNQTWQKYPAAMLRARAISAVARMAFPDSIGGMYTPDELGAEVDIDREGGFVVIDAAAETPVVEVIDQGTGEILPEPTPRPSEEDLYRIATDLRGDLTAGKLGLLEREVERYGLDDHEEIGPLLHEARERRDAARARKEQVKAGQTQFIEG